MYSLYGQATFCEALSNRGDIANRGDPSHSGDSCKSKGSSLYVAIGPPGSCVYRWGNQALAMAVEPFGHVLSQLQLEIAQGGISFEDSHGPIRTLAKPSQSWGERAFYWPNLATLRKVTQDLSAQQVHVSGGSQAHGQRLGKEERAAKARPVTNQVCGVVGVLTKLEPLMLTERWTNGWQHLEDQCVSLDIGW